MFPLAFITALNKAELEKRMVGYSIGQLFSGGIIVKLTITGLIEVEHKNGLMSYHNVMKF